MRAQKTTPAETVEYDNDVILWAEEQARLLRAGRFAELDIEHIADEIEDVGKSEKRELANRMAVRLAHLPKWRFQPEKRMKRWRTTIEGQRRAIDVAVRSTPSLKTVMRDPEWSAIVGDDALAEAERETGLEDLPEICPFDFDEARDPTFWPE